MILAQRFIAGNENEDLISRPVGTIDEFPENPAMSHSFTGSLYYCVFKPSIVPTGLPVVPVPSASISFYTCKAAIVLKSPWSER